MSIETYLTLQIIIIMVGIITTVVLVADGLEENDFIDTLKGVPVWYMFLMLLAWPLTVIIMILVMCVLIIGLILEFFSWIFKQHWGRWLAATPFKSNQGKKK